MPTLQIDNVDYDTETLSEAAKQHLQMLQLAEQEIQRLQLQLAMTQTARNAYAQALKTALPTPVEQVLAQGDTLKLS